MSGDEGEDGDDGDEGDSNDEDLDFGEDDYEDSEVDDEAVDKDIEKGDKKKTSTLTIKELEKIFTKATNGSTYALMRVSNIFAKFTNPEKKAESLDEENIYNNPKYYKKILKFCIKSLPEIFDLKLTSTDTKDNESSLSSLKEVLKKYLGTYSKMLKNSDSAIINYAYTYIGNILPLILLYKVSTINQ